MDQQDPVIACLHRLEADNRRMRQIGATALGLLALGLLAAMAWQQDPDTVAVQNIVRIQRLELTNAEGKVVAVLSAANIDPAIHTTYHSNGLKAAQFSVRDNCYDGHYTAWRESGLKIVEGDYNLGLRHGTWVWWHTPRAGVQLDHTRAARQRQVTFVNGLRHGIETNWHRNGQKRSEVTYENDLPVGLSTGWSDDGTKTREGRYENGKETGEWAWWWPNGTRNAVGEYREGKRFGIWTTWHENGQKNSEGEHRDGERMGHWTFWNEDGSIDEEQTGFYENGEKIR